jgi:pimeloyl-ACP methyl ester carboxylesterase
MKKEGLDYSIDGRNFSEVLFRKLYASQFNLVGNSMGGHTAAAYAIKYPNDLTNLILLDAAGIKIDDHVVYNLVKKLKTKKS